MYDNATKDTWRGFVWNQVADRLKRCPGTKQRVCVLAGDIAADRECATKRKLECVAVDCNLSAVKTFRKAGGVAIQDQLVNQIRVLQPSAVIADLVCGITPSVREMYFDAIFLCDVVVFNLLRGRDKGVGEYVRAARKHNIEVPEVVGRNMQWAPVNKHRGRLLFASAVGALARDCCGTGGSNADDEIARFIEKEAWEMMPRYYSYQSKDSGQYFDTVVVTSNIFSRYTSVEIRKRERLSAPKASRQRAAAAKAILTTRRRLRKI